MVRRRDCWYFAGGVPHPTTSPLHSTGKGKNKEKEQREYSPKGREKAKGKGKVKGKEPYKGKDKYNGEGKGKDRYKGKRKDLDVMPKERFNELIKKLVEPDTGVMGEGLWRIPPQIPLTEPTLTTMINTIYENYRDGAPDQDSNWRLNLRADHEQNEIKGTSRDDNSFFVREL